MTLDLLEGLNPQQREAVTAGEGPVLVLAGPGSGKTRVLTHRIAYLIREMAVPSWGLVAVTFTNKAAAEMRQRVEASLGGRLDGLSIGTFHAICARLLRVEADYTPYERDYVIYDTDDQMTAVKQVLAELNVDSKKFNPGRVLGAISTAKNELIEPGEFVSRDYFGEVVMRVYPRYQSLLVSSNAMDFDDLLMQTALLLRSNDDIREKYQQRFMHVLVDEFQDTNQAQYQLVEMLGKPQDNIFVVGDEDQGIYAFRGADYRNVMQFRRDYPDARVILLEQNYRSTQVVLDAARSVIDKNSHRTPKALFTDRVGGPPVTIHEAYTEAEEAEFVVSTLQRKIKRGEYHYNDIAIMYRTNAQSRALEDACVGLQVPYKLVGGVGFYKRREVRDLLSYMRLVNNPNDAVSFGRVVNVPGRGIGKKSVETFAAWLAESGFTQRQALEAIADGQVAPLAGRAGRSLTEFAVMLAELRQLIEGNDLTVLFDEIVSRIGYNLYLHEISESTEELEDRTQNVGELRGVVESKKDLSLNDALEELALVAEIDSLDESLDKVTLLTLHAAKGLEFSVVFITGLEDGLLPHSRSFGEPDAMAEERRLFYVGLTRAKDHLYLSYAFRRSLYGESIPGLPSRFLSDIPTELTEGASIKLNVERERASFRKAYTWSSDESPSAKPAAPRKKVIPFASAAARAAAPVMRYTPGLRVTHAKFGEGIVIESQRYGQDEEVTVAFEKFGLKRLAASFANLQILGK
jgi:DNA helicase-2/ATP-dependent DNA helicase PcrA